MSKENPKSRIKDLPKIERPREKLIAKDAQSLKDEEKIKSGKGLFRLNFRENIGRVKEER